MRYVNVARLQFEAVFKKSTHMSQHEQLKDAHVYEATLRVAFGARPKSIPRSTGKVGAPCRGTTFQLLTRRSKYVMISLTLGTRVPLTTVRVTFGARCRLDPEEHRRGILRRRERHAHEDS